MSDSTLDASSTDRLQQIMDLLEEDWQSYESLEMIFGKPERTLRRDFERIEALGHKLEIRRDGRQKQFRMVPGTRKRPIEPGILEVLAANLGRGTLGFLQGTALSQEMEALFQQLRSNSRATERQLKDLDKKFWFMADAPRDYASSDEQLDQLITCILDQKVASVGYRSRAQTAREILLRPYTLIVRRECLYVLGVEEDGHGQVQTEPRLFDVTRVDKVKRLRRNFELPTDWDPARCFKDSFGVFIPREGEESAVRVQIRFEPAVARAIQLRRWHDSQTWKETRQGPVLELSVRLCPELTHWILSFGPAAKVVGPPALKAAVMKELREALALYTKDLSTP